MTSITNQRAASVGLSLNIVPLASEWYVVEHADGTASIHPTWDEAYIAGNFDTDE